MHPKAYWIWQEHGFEPRESYVRFRRTFDLNGTSGTFTVSVSADSRYRLYLNGRYVAYGPARGYPHRPFVDTIDVSRYMRKGRNVVAVLVYQPGYSHFSYVHRAASGLILTLYQGRKCVLVSDTSFKAAPDPSFESSVQRVSIYGSGQECRDLRLHETWTRVAYRDEDWPRAKIVACRGDEPWTGLQARPIPLLEEKLLSPAFVECCEGTVRPHTDPHEIVRQAYTHRNAGARHEAETVKALGRNRARMYFYQLPQSLVGSPVIDVRGAQGGERLLVTVLEKGSPGEWVFPDPSTYCRFRPTDHYTLAPGRQQVEPFTPRGGRVIVLSLIGPLRGDALDLKVRFRRRRYPLQVKKHVTTVKAPLKPILRMCTRTLRACAQDGMVDGPYREQAQWTGDLLVTGRILAHCFGDHRLLEFMLTNCAEGVDNRGLLPGVAPSEAHTYKVLNFNFSWIDGLARHYEATGKKDLAQSMWPVLQGVLGAFRDDRDRTGLIHARPGYRFFLDWANLSTNEPNGLYNLQVLWGLQTAASLAGKIGRPSDRQRWSRWAGDLQRAVTGRFYRKGAWYDDVAKTRRSQHTAAMAVLTGLRSGSAAHGLMDEVVARSLDENHMDLTLASPYFHYFIFEALQALGRLDDIERIVLYRWGHWLKQGATTCWENWDIDFPDGSACHGWSTSPLLYLTGR